ncbi:hypothetical protein FHS61_001430 [Altererythrobacter atlanticus]|uniref:Uncharacterized protein n=1 Tax=Croceibacterium atlanticum TaxID=1267766 RepID=A0A0F7KXZ0_9SPHN|nr:hypothetical protein [Croceibacterium atlanticum]AKH44111.1 hypothetical protein WYH_03092 [Croceibacterium atlanticum]MBB5732421.1 hypothetical protein [Croceibacterium atlanticum]
MPIIPNRAVLTVAGAAAFAAAPLPVSAQVDRDIVLNILLECAKIADPMARVSCYDNNIRRVEPSAAAAVPDRGQDRQPASPAFAEGAATQTRAAVAPVRQDAPPPRGESSFTPVIASISERSPGAFLVTLEDGASWEYSDNMPLSYRPPRRGSKVEIERGSLGSYLLRYDNQQPARVRRVR